MTARHTCKVYLVSDGAEKQNNESILPKPANGDESDLPLKTNGRLKKKEKKRFDFEIIKLLDHYSLI